MIEPMPPITTTANTTMMRSARAMAGRSYGIRVSRTVWLRHELSLAHEVPRHPERPERLAGLLEAFPDFVEARPAALSFEAANPRHAHEWTVFEDVDLPEGKVLIPGVLDSTTNYIEHPELVAQRPLARRDDSRLLVYERSTGRVEHARFGDLPRLLPAETLVVVNDTRVLPARLKLRRPGGGEAEVLLLERLEGDEWEALARPSRRLKQGMRLGAVELLELLVVGDHDADAHGASSAMSEKALSMSPSQICSSRSPGVSIRMAPSGMTSSCR
jgi:hypothetical protein